MAFVRRCGNNTTLIETHRTGDAVKHRRIANLYGRKTVPEALQEIERQIAEHEQWLRGNPYDAPNDTSDRRQPLFSYIDENGKMKMAMRLSIFHIDRPDKKHASMKGGNGG